MLLPIEYRKLTCQKKKLSMPFEVLLKTKGDVFSLIDKIDKRIVLDVLRVKPSEQRKASLCYLVDTGHAKILPYRQFNIKEICIKNHKSLPGGSRDNNVPRGEGNGQNTALRRQIFQPGRRSTEAGNSSSRNRPKISD